MTWELDDTAEEESSFCVCGVVDDLDQAGLCSVCANAPHGRDCPCDACDDYWRLIADGRDPEGARTAAVAQ